MKADLLLNLQQKLEASCATLPLVSQKEDVVPGEGFISASIMMIGEAPGYHETLHRRPFVGRSGQLLRKTIIEVGLDLKDIFISNIVKVRPPENRDPTPAEIAAFQPFLDEEISLIRPKLIITLGRFSMNKFLPEAKISNVHGQLHQIKWLTQTYFILPMYHPAAALRNGRVKKLFIKDFTKIEKILVWLRSKKSVLQSEQVIKEILFE